MSLLEAAAAVLHSVAIWLTTLEAAAAGFGILAVWLTTRENVWCWPTGLINVGLYIIVFYQARLYADMGLQLVYVVLCIYGWYHWLHGGKDHGKLQVSRVTARSLGVSFLVAVVFFLILGFVLARTTNADLPYLDSALASFSLVAQYFQTRKWIENWIVWIAVDIVYVGMYIYKQLYLTAGLYAVFLVLAVVGYSKWRQTIDSRRSHGV